MRFTLRDETPAGVDDEKFFFRTVRAAFSQRRKTLANSVASGMSADKPLVLAAIADAGLADNIRPEQLTMGQFIAFANALKKRI